MKYSSRFFLYAPVALFLLLAAGACTWWWQAAEAFEARLAARKGHEIIPGIALDWSKVTVSGFPFRLDAVFDNFSAHGAGPHGPFSWASDRFAIHALTYGAQKDVFEAAGNQRLAWTGAEGEAHYFSFLPGSLRASAVRDERGLARFDLDIVALNSRSVGIGRAQFHMRRDPDGKSIDLMAEGDVVRGGQSLLSGAAKSLRVYQTLSNGAAFAGLLRGEATPAAADAAWRKAGGTARITGARRDGRTLTPQQAQAANRLLAPLY